jgi:CDP-paratose 2-epimerase
MVGSHAAEQWAAKWHEVIVLDNLMRSALFGSQKESVEYNWRYLGSLKGIQLIKGDVRSAEDVRRALGDGVDLVLHAAGQPGVGFSIEHPEEDFAINALGTLQVLETTRQQSPKAVFIYCSTNKVYGTNVDAIPLVEQASRYAYGNGLVGISEQLSVDYAGHTPYGVSKLAGELYVQDYAYTYGMRTAVFRLSCTYGTRQFGFEDQGWVAHFTISTLLGRPITIYGDGKQVRDALFVDDLINAFDLFMASPVKHGVFNIGGGPTQTVSLRELLDELERLTGKRSPVAYAPWRPSDQKVYISDLSRVQQALRWAPRVTFPEGLRRLVRWVEEHRGLF